MAVFKFRLQPLLEQRKLLTEKAEEQLAQRKKELAEAEAELRSLEQQEKDMEALLAQTRVDFLNAPISSGEQLRQHRDHIQVMNAHLDEARDNTTTYRITVDQIRETVTAARAEVDECRRQEEILMKYRDKQEQRFRAEEERKEAAEADELGTTMYLGRRAQ
jgi:flagellar export protein FliJ